jgi:hypothetical protein
MNSMRRNPPKWFYCMAQVRQKIRELCDEKSYKSLQSKMRQFSLEIIIRVPALNESTLVHNIYVFSQWVLSFYVD